MQVVLSDDSGWSETMHVDDLSHAIEVASDYAREVVSDQDHTEWSIYVREPGEACCVATVTAKRVITEESTIEVEIDRNPIYAQEA